MSAALLRARWIFGWTALALFALFAANVVLAKLSSTFEFSVPLFSVLAEFILLHAATIAGVAFLLCEERRRSAGPEDQWP